MDNQGQDIIPSIPIKPKIEAKINEAIQESQLNQMCNDAYDELLIQEFNPDQEDFEGDDNHGEEDPESLVVCLEEYGKGNFLLCV
jgi:hypothetical protein